MAPVTTLACLRIHRDDVNLAADTFGPCDRPAHTRSNSTVRIVCNTVASPAGRMYKPNSTVIGELAHAKRIIEEYTGNKFHFFHQVEDPTLIYVLGEWASVDQHVNRPFASTLYKRFNRLISEEWTIYLDLSGWVTRLGTATAFTRGGLLNITRHFGKKGMAGQLANSVAERKKYVDSIQDRPGLVECGRKLHVKGLKETHVLAEENPEIEEWVLFSPWSLLREDAFTTERKDYLVGMTEYVGKPKNRFWDGLDRVDMRRARILPINTDLEPSNEEIPQPQSKQPKSVQPQNIHTQNAQSQNVQPQDLQLPNVQSDNLQSQIMQPLLQNATADSEEEKCGCCEKDCCLPSVWCSLM